MIRRKAYKTAYSKDELIELCRRRDEGDQEAVRLMVESQIPWALKLAYKFSRRKCEESEMAAIEAVYIAVSKFDPLQGSLSGWIVRPVKWAVRDSMVFHGSVLKRSGAGWAYRLKDKSMAAFNARNMRKYPLEAAIDHRTDQPDENAETLETNRRLHAAIDALPPRRRDIVRMRMQDMTLSQIGRMLGCTKEAVRQQEALAFNTIREMIAAGEGEPCSPEELLAARRY